MQAKGQNRDTMRAEPTRKDEHDPDYDPGAADDRYACFATITIITAALTTGLIMVYLIAYA